MRSKLALALLLITAGAQPVAAQYQQALPGYRYEFPRDHFDHPEYRTEWWYYTGNLKAADGRRFGFELTSFRQGMDRSEASTGNWEVRDLYLAHLAVSDIDGQHFYYSERVNRAGPGIAGASLQAGKVWNGNWQAQWSKGEQHLQALADDFAFDLSLRSSKPPVIHGRNGISTKGTEAGNASHYISFTRLMTSGTLQINGKSYSVAGTSWMDHEFFSSGLDKDEVGWDWLSLQLDDDTELMLYRLRHKDGSVDPFSSGTFVDAAGRSSFLGQHDFAMIPAGASYLSRSTNASYPISWNVVIPALGLNLRVSTPLAAQELASGTASGLSYWEGAMNVSGTRHGAPIGGVGYLEMTGYAKRLELGGPVRDME